MRRETSFRGYKSYFLVDNSRENLKFIQGALAISCLL